jgi:predicted deacetylase
MSREKILLASIHDVGPRAEAQVDQLADLLTDLLHGLNFAMLVVPDHWSEAPLATNAAYQAKLRRWSELGWKCSSMAGSTRIWPSTAAWRPSRPSI